MGQWRWGGEVDLQDVTCKPRVRMVGHCVGKDVRFLQELQHWREHSREADREADQERFHWNEIEHE